ncbi:hypothetical protein [Mycoplasmopsis caviae]|uniref:Uncharacterized protein n=1 Tax=Mycoplasmopsis caviae TaxID=55603 RepID=A0A3P8ME23_9BACT|nr:hypothetical protein [Mycoplasmopsis caviae]VDR42530.1 Uncharacterised protein [Mycoplasmopsis caviae]
MVKFVPDNDKIKQEIPGKLVLTYSEKRAKKDRYDRERLVEKAKKLIKNSQSIARSELQKGGKKYLDYDVNKITLKEQKIEDDANEMAFMVYSQTTLRWQMKRFCILTENFDKLKNRSEY